jgi:hypothetical protein
MAASLCGALPAAERAVTPRKALNKQLIDPAGFFTAFGFGAWRSIK